MRKAPAGEHEGLEPLGVAVNTTSTPGAAAGPQNRQGVLAENEDNGAGASLPEAQASENSKGVACTPSLTPFSGCAVLSLAEARVQVKQGVFHDQSADPRCEGQPADFLATPPSFFLSDGRDVYACETTAGGVNTHRLAVEQTYTDSQRQSNRLILCLAAACLSLEESPDDSIDPGKRESTDPNNRSSEARAETHCDSHLAPGARRVAVALAVSYSDKTTTVYLLDGRCEVQSWARVECAQKVSTLLLALGAQTGAETEKRQVTLLLVTRGGMVYSVALPLNWKAGGEAIPLVPDEPVLGRCTALSAGCVSSLPQQAGQVLFIADRTGVMLSARVGELYRILSIWPDAHEVRSCSTVGPSGCAAATDTGVYLYDPGRGTRRREVLGLAGRPDEYFADVCTGEGLLVLSFDASEPMRAHIRVFREEDVVFDTEEACRQTPPETAFSTTVPVGPASPENQEEACAQFASVARRSACIPLQTGFLIAFWAGAAYLVRRDAKGQWEAVAVDFRVGRESVAAPGGPGPFYASGDLATLEGLRVPPLAVRGKAREGIESGEADEAAGAGETEGRAIAAAVNHTDCREPAEQETGSGEAGADDPARVR